MRLALFAGAAAFLLATAPVGAQQVPPPTRPDTTRRPQPTPADTGRRAPAADTTRAAVGGDTTRADTALVRRVKPGIAFLKSLVVPGWGQASAHAYGRAAVFVTLQGASWFMLLKTLNKVSKAQDEVNLNSPLIRDSLLHQAPDSLKYQDLTPAGLKLVSDSLSPGFDLLKSRKKQREDWITLTVFWTLASGVDAFINAQLQDFPAGVDVEPKEGGGTRVTVRVPASGLLHPGDLLHRRKPLPPGSAR